MTAKWDLRAISIRLRLRIAFTVVVLLMLAGSSLSFLQFRDVTRHGDRLSRAEQRLSALLRLNSSLITLMNQLHRAAEKQDAAYFKREADRLMPGLRLHSQTADSTLQEIGRENGRPAVLAGSIQSILEGLPQRVDTFVELAESGDWVALHARLLNQADQTDDVVALLMEQADAGLAGERKRLMDDLDRAQRRAANALALGAVLSLAAAGILGTLVTYSITRPLSALSEGADALAAGRFEHRVPTNGNDELAHLAQSFNRSAGELARLFEEVKSERASAEAAHAALQLRAQELARLNNDLQQFAYSATHDLQEPLRMLAIYSQLLHREYSGKLDESAEEYIDYLFRSARQMEQLITDLLAYTQTANGSHEVGAPIDVKAVLDRVLGSLELQIRDQRARIIAGPLPAVQAREIHVQQLFQNLIGNSLKYRSKLDPEVHISAERQSDYWLFYVRDNGIGFDPQYEKYVFGIFKRLHGQKYPGTGMGLAICQRIVESYGGRISAQSAPGQGSTFLFTLPAVPVITLH